MNRGLTAKELFELSKAFHALSVILGNYRYDNWDMLSAKQRSELENNQWTIFNTASDLNAGSVLLKVKLMEEDINVLKDAASSMEAAANKIQNIKHVISIAAKAVAFGGAIYAAFTGNIAALTPAASALIKEIDS